MKILLSGLGAFGVSVICSLVAWSRMPERVPVHWGFDGRPDRFGSRWELVLIGPALVLFTWALLAVAVRIDPKIRAQQTALAADPSDEEARAALGQLRSSRETFVAVTLAFLAVMANGILFVGAGLLGDVRRVIAVSMALFLLLGGNFLGRVRPNWFIGVRTPWTLSSDEVWRKTHRLAGRLMVAGGALLLPIGLLLSGPALGVAMIALPLLSLLPPVVASYFFWRARAA